MRKETEDSNNSDNQGNADHMMCPLHKRKIEFVCLNNDCESNKYLCPLCIDIHKKHESSISSIENIVNKAQKRECSYRSERLNILEDEVGEIRRIVKTIQKMVTKYERKQINSIEKQFKNIKMSVEEDKLKFFRDFSDTLHLDTTNLFSIPPVVSEFNYNRIRESAHLTLNLIQGVEYNISDLIGYLFRQDHLYYNETKRSIEIIENSVRNTNAPHQQMQPDQNIFQNGRLRRQGEHILLQRRIGHVELSGVVRVSENIFLFWDETTIYYYQFVERKILAKTQFDRNIEIRKVITHGHQELVLIVRQDIIGFPEHGFGEISLTFSVFSLKRIGQNIIKQRVFEQTGQTHLLDIIPVKRSNLVLIVQEESNLVVINILTCQVMSKIVFTHLHQIYKEQMDILSCSIIENFKFHKTTYVRLLQINFTNGKYYLHDFVSKQKVQLHSLRNPIGFEYKYSTALHIPFSDSPKHFLLIKGDRNETYIQTCFEGQLQIKMHHCLPQYFDMFNNGQAVPFYFQNTLFFYDLINQKRLKTISLPNKQNQTTYSQSFSQQNIFPLPQRIVLPQDNGQERSNFSRIWDEQIEQDQENISNQRNLVELMTTITDSQIHPVDSLQQQRQLEGDQGEVQWNNQQNMFTQLRPYNDDFIIEHDTINNHTLCGICPLAVINHFDYIVLVYNSGVIQYIK